MKHEFLTTRHHQTAQDSDSLRKKCTQEGPCGAERERSKVARAHKYWKESAAQGENSRVLIECLSAHAGKDTKRNPMPREEHPQGREGAARAPIKSVPTC